MVFRQEVPMRKYVVSNADGSFPQLEEKLTES